MENEKKQSIMENEKKVLNTNDVFEFQLAVDVLVENFEKTIKVVDNGFKEANLNADIQLAALNAMELVLLNRLEGGKIKKIMFARNYRKLLIHFGFMENKNVINNEKRSL